MRQKVIPCYSSGIFLFSIGLLDTRQKYFTFFFLHCDFNTALESFFSLLRVQLPWSTLSLVLFQTHYRVLQTARIFRKQDFYRSNNLYRCIRKIRRPTLLTSAPINQRAGIGMHIDYENGQNRY